MTEILLNKTVGINLKAFIPTRALIQGISGSGKTVLAKRICERSFDKVQHIIFDTEDEFAPLREKFDYVLAGNKGDIPVKVEYATTIAKRTMEEGFSIILNLSDMDLDTRAEFIKLFIEQLFKTKEKYRRPCLVIIDECHLYSPQLGETVCSKAVLNLAARGRKYGFCLIAITQRITKLHKDVSAELSNKFIGKTFQDLDMKRAASELGFNKSQMLLLRKLKPGQFYVFGDAISEEVIKIKVGKIQTHHPQPGQITKYKPVPPGKAIKRILSKLGDIPKEIEDEKQSEKDKDKMISELQQKIKDLEKDFAKAAKELNPEKMKEYEELIKEQESKIHDLNFCLQTMNGIFKEAGGLVDSIDKVVITLSSTSEKLRSILVNADKPTPKKLKGVEKVRASLMNPVSVQDVFKRENSGKQISDNTAKGKILYALTTFNSTGLNKNQLKLACGFSGSSAYFNNVIGELKRDGLISLKDKHYFSANVEVIGEYSGPVDMIEAWRGVLGDGLQRQIFEFLLDNSQDSFTKPEIINGVGFTGSSAYFSNVVGEVKRMGLINGSSGSYTISPDYLFVSK